MSATVSIFNTYALPSSIATKRNLSHLVQELERLDNELTAAAVQGGSETPELSVPDMVQDFLSVNEFSLDNTNDRSEMITQLRLLKRKAPVIHIAFAVEADSASLGSLIGWFREFAHPQSIIVAGFQPSLVAGAYVRTPNHIYDLSLRSAFRNGRAKLIQELEAVSGDK